MIAFKRIKNEYTDRRLREVGFTVVYYEDIGWAGSTPTLDGRPITDNLWYFRAVGREYELVRNLIGYAEEQGIWYMDKYLETDGPGPRSKWLHYNKMKESGIPQPITSIFDLNCSFDPETLPYVLKASTGGRRGLYTFMIRERGDRDRVMETLSEREKYKGKNKEWLVQEYIPNEGDYRAFVVGDRCVGMYKRRPKDSVGLVMNTSDGKSRRYVNNRWPTDVARLAVQAAMSLNVTVAGVDLVRHTRTRDLYVIEVNEAPSFKVMEKRTRLDIAGEIAKEMKRHGT